MGLSTTMSEALRLTRAGKLDAAAALLRRLPGAPAAAPAPATPGPPPPGAGEFRAHRFEGLGYKLYVPPGATAGRPLLVMLHGCSQSPDDFARGTRMNELADRHGLLVAWPGQSQAANAQKCWNWFRPGDQAAGAGEPALIAGMTRHIVAEQRADPARVFVAGLSAGGAAAAVMAAAYPALYAGVGVHSGLACGAAHDLPSALAAMRNGAAARGAVPFVPLITLHGDSDTTVAEANARALVTAARAAHPGQLTSRSEPGRTAGGRRYQRAVDVDARGRVRIEQWTITGAGHAWSGGSAAGSYTDPGGPDASAAIVAFFLGLS